MTHSEKIILWMRDNDVTQETLGKSVGMSQPAVSDMLTKGAFPGSKNARAISRLMGCTMDWLFDESKSYPPPATDARAIVLTDAERKVLEFAREVSVHDADPAALRSAIDRMLGTTAFQAIEAMGAARFAEPAQGVTRDDAVPLPAPPKSRLRRRG